MLEPLIFKPPFKDDVSIWQMHGLTTHGRAANHGEFDSALYPRTYQASVANQFIWISLGSLVAIGGFCGAFYFGTGHETRGLRGEILMGCVSLMFVLFGAYIVLWMLRSQIILQSDAIEVRNIFSTRIVRREEIEWWRILPTQYISTLEVTPTQEGKKLKIGLTIKTDAQFHAWFAGLPNLDSEELAKSEVQIAAHQEPGVRPEQLAEHRAEAKNIAQWLNRITFAIVVWGWIYPRPYQLAVVVLTAMPLVAIALLVRTKGLYQIEGRRNDARPSLAIPFILPGLILLLRSVTDFSFLRWESMLAWVMIGGLGITFVVASADWGARQRRSSVLVILLFSATFVFGAIAQANILLDKSVPATFRATVLNKRISSGRTTSWYLRVGPWGPQSRPTEVSVSRSLYNNVLPNQTVCVHLSDGGLKIPWYFISGCP